MTDYLDEHVEKILPLTYQLVKDSNMGIVIEPDLIRELVQGGFSYGEAEEMIKRGKERKIIP